MSATRPPSFDERYAAPVEASRRGAHRARPNPLTSVLPVVAGVAVVLLVVVGAWALLGNRGNGSGTQNPPPAAAEPTQSAPASQGSEVPAPSASASASASASEEPSPGAEESEAAGEVDRSHEMRVRSSVSVAGTAKRVADALEEKGWTGIGEVGNANARNLAVTKVYYATDDDKAAAEAIVEDLGYGETKKSATNAGDEGITVVIGKDALED